MSFSKLDYGQYLLSSPVNYTVTNIANHLDGVSHDRINCYLCGETLTPRLLWDNVKSSLQADPHAYDWGRSLSVLQSPDSAQSYCLCVAGLDAVEDGC